MTMHVGKTSAGGGTGTRSGKGRALLAVLALAVTFWLGTVWQTHADVGSGVPREVPGTASLLGDDSAGWTVAFEADDGASSSLLVDNVQWVQRSGGNEGGGNPPCLKAGRPLRTQAGLLNVRTSGGGGYVSLAYLVCP